MKKLAVTLFACMALMQSTFAATSALTESLLEFEAITNAIGTNPLFQNVIPATEFITDIDRITPQVDITGNVKYEITTRVLNSASESSLSIEEENFEHYSTSQHRGRHRQNNTYIATLFVSPNPAIGPNIVTVLSIKKTHSHTSTIFEDESQLLEEFVN